MAKWVLNPVALHKASTQILGIKEPVSIRTGNLYWAGQYVPEPLHVIWINPELEPHSFENPSHTIWHELAHAMQCERDYDSDVNKYFKATNALYKPLISAADNPVLNGRVVKYGTPAYDEWYDVYMQIQPECEAEQIADRYYQQYPLVRIKV